MTCREAERLVMPYINGSITDEELKEFLKHIETCEDCREELEIYFTVDVGIRQLDQETGTYNIKGALDALGLTPLCHGSQYIIRLKPLKGHDGNSHGLQHILHHGNLLMKLLGHGLSRALIGVIHLMPEGRLL